MRLKKTESDRRLPCKPTQQRKQLFFETKKKKNIFKTFYKNFWTVDIKVLLTKISYRFCNFFFINLFFFEIVCALLT